MSAFISKVKHVTTKYPLLRGMLSYSLIWPTSALIQQAIAGKKWGIHDFANTFWASFFIIYYYNGRHNWLGQMLAI